MGHRQCWATSIHTGERLKNSPYAQSTGVMWTHACISKETGNNGWMAAETAGNTEKLPEKLSCKTQQN
jgi:hypothetical protein